MIIMTIICLRIGMERRLIISFPVTGWCLKT